MTKIFGPDQIEAALARARAKHEAGRSEFMERMEALGFDGEEVFQMTWEAFERSFRQTYQKETLQ